VEVVNQADYAAKDVLVDQNVTRTVHTCTLDAAPKTNENHIGLLGE
jgi:hypothetical protein